MKPVALFEHLVRNSTPEAGVVADFFAGSGTAVLAAELSGRTALVAEADPRYADVIRRRWYEAIHPEATEAEPGAWREATPLLEEALV
jgi:DNA modification methylase